MNIPTSKLFALALCCALGARAEAPAPLPSTSDAGPRDAGIDSASDAGSCATAPPDLQREIPQLLGAGMSRPMPSESCAPRSPTETGDARQAGLEGMVLVSYVVHSDGSVGEISLKNPAAHPELVKIVEEWLRQCRFIPSRSGGKAIAVKLIQPFVFKRHP